MQRLSISVVVPALNEGAYLASCIDALRASFPADPGVPLEILVVDNGSEDDTAKVGGEHGARILFEPEGNVAKARNAGARAASGTLLVFLDADTLVPPSFGTRLLSLGSDPALLGGAFDTDQRARRAILRVYLAVWRWIGLAFGMAQGAAQFCTRDAFEVLGGYDERLYMGEDVDFYWRLKRLARRQGRRVVFVRAIRVVPSARRFDSWPLWKTLLWTNPAVVAALGRWKAVWQGWYHSPPR